MISLYQPLLHYIYAAYDFFFLGLWYLILHPPLKNGPIYEFYKINLVAIMKL